MNAFALTYSIVWSVLILYVVSLNITQRRLTRAAEALQRPLARHNKESSKSGGDHSAIGD